MRSDGVEDAQSLSDGAASPGRRMRLSTERAGCFGSSAEAGTPVLFGVSDMITIYPMEGSICALPQGRGESRAEQHERPPPRPHRPVTYSFGSSITCRISCRSSSIGATRAQRAHYALNFRLGSTVVYCHE